MTASRTKLFLSHASEDKSSIADALAEALRSDYDLWYDKYKLTLGDSLLGKISEGLREADFGVVILSGSFFGKKWTQGELDGLFALEEANRKVILPVWHDVSVEEVRSYSPILAGRLGIRTSEGVSAIVSAIHTAVDAAKRMGEFDVLESFKGRLLKIDSHITDEKRSRQLLNTVEGVGIVRGAVDRCVESLVQMVAALAESLSSTEFRIGDGVNDASERVLTVRMPYQLTFSLNYFNGIINSAQGACLSIGIWRIKRDPWGDITERSQIVEKRLIPRILGENKVVWKDEQIELSEDQITIYVGDLMISEVEKSHDKISRNR